MTFHGRAQKHTVRRDVEAVLAAYTHTIGTKDTAAPDLDEAVLFEMKPGLFAAHHRYATRKIAQFSGVEDDLGNCKTLGKCIHGCAKSIVSA